MALRPETTLCRFECIKVTKRKGFNGHPFVFDAEFQACYRWDDTNDEAFFAATPTGTLHVLSILPDHFEVGAKYLLDIRKDT